MTGYLFKDANPLLWIEEDSEFAEFIKRQNFAREEDINIYNYRLLSKRYLENVQQPYKQQVVLKIINRGSSINHLKILLDYINREGKKFENEQSIGLLNRFGEELDKGDYSELIKEWEIDFDDNEDQDQNLIEGVEEINRYKSVLNDKSFTKVLTAQENNFLLEAKKFTQARKVSAEISPMSFVQDKDGQFGFVAEIKNNDATIVSLDRSGELVSHERPVSEIENTGYKIKNSQALIRKNFTHMLLSVGGDSPNPDNSKQATLDFLNTTLGARGYDYLVAMHNDTKNLHFHVVVKNKSEIKDMPKFKPNQYDLLGMRLDYTTSLDRYGIDRAATYERDRAEYLSKLNKRAARTINHDMKWWEHKLSETSVEGFNALRFRKKILSELGVLSEQYKKEGLKDMSIFLDDKAEEFKKMEHGQIQTAIKQTVKALQDNNADLKTFAIERLDQAVGQEDFQVKKIEIDRIADKHMEELHAQRKTLQKLDRAELSEEMQKRQEKAMDHLKSMAVEVERIKKHLGKDTGKSQDRSREIEDD